MNNLDHVKNYYPENYKLDLSETMKAALSKSSNSVRNPMEMAGNGVGYVTEKLYLYLQLYLQNKGWNPDLQCFAELKDNSMLPSASYLQVLANRLTLDQQGRLILRENGKIVLPFEHFANAVMLKHMSGPHGIHLSLEATVRAVIESYTIGRENFGMEKEFIIEVVQSCPSPACRYNKNYLGLPSLPFLEQQFPGVNHPEFLQHMPHLPPPPPPPNQLAANSAVNNNCTPSMSSSSVAEVEMKTPQHAPPQPSPKLMVKHQQNSLQSQLQNAAAAAAAVAHQQQVEQQLQQQQMQQQQAALAKQQQQLTAALIHQQNRALAQQSLEKFSNLSALEKQRILQQLEPKHFDPMAVAAANMQMQAIQSQASVSAASAAAAANPPPNAPISMVGASNMNNLGSGMVPSAITNMPNMPPNNAHAHAQQHPHLPPPTPSPTIHTAQSHLSVSHSSSSTSSTPLSSASSSSHEQLVQKSSELLRSNMETLESNKDLLALHNGSWSSGAQEFHSNVHEVEMTARCQPNSDAMPVGQDKIIRVFTELIRNMARMKTYIRPSMCKPYGKQSESLQKTLLDTIQIVQTLRNCLPAPHIPVSSWKSESEGGGGGVGGGGGGAGANVSAGMMANNGMMGGTAPNSAGPLNSNRLENMSN